MLPLQQRLREILSQTSEFSAIPIYIEDKLGESHILQLVEQGVATLTQPEIILRTESGSDRDAAMGALMLREEISATILWRPTFAKPEDPPLLDLVAALMSAVHEAPISASETDPGALTFAVEGHSGATGETGETAHEVRISAPFVLPSAYTDPEN